jgi:Amiloride-sensitive sodium channel.
MFLVCNKMLVYFLKVYIHLPHKFPVIGTGILMPQDQRKVFQVQVTPSITESSRNVRALSISQRNCLFPDELRLSVFKTYTQQNCLLECRLRNIASYCGCYPYFFSAFTGT